MGIATQYEGGLKFDGNQMYITTSSGTTLLTLGNTGNATFVGTIGATNFSGSSSGTNTGDQTLPTLSSLGGASSGYLTNTGGAKLEIQNGQDGGSSYGIYMWTSSNTDWGIYMSQAGAGKALNDGTASSGIDGATAHAIRFRVNDNSAQAGFIWENNSNETLMQLNGGTEKLYTKNAIYPSNQTTNYVDSTRIANWQTAYGWGDHGLSAQDKTDISNLSGVNTGDQTLPTLSSLGALSKTLSIVDIGSPDASTGTWVDAATNAWGFPRIGSHNARYADGAATLTFNIPSGADTAYISQLAWSSGGYADVFGIQSDGGNVFLRRVNTKQNVQNANEGNNEHDGATVTLIGSGLSHYSSIKIVNQSGRIHLTGLGFSEQSDFGTEGTGMINPAQITHSYNNTNWDTAYTHSQAAHAPSNAEQNVQSDWNATSGDSFIQNKPTLGTAAAAATTDFATASHNHGGVYALEYELMQSDASDKDMHVWRKNHAMLSDNSGANTYIIVQTNVPQDNYSMGGFTLVYQDNYNTSDEGGEIKIYGYWNPESNGGFQAFRYECSNPYHTPTIEVCRNSSSGKTAFFISGEGGSYTQLLAKDLWLGYTASSATSQWGDSWAVTQASAKDGYTNFNTLNRNDFAAITTNGSTPSLTGGVSATEIRTLIGAGTGSSNLAIGTTATTAMAGDTTIPTLASLGALSTTAKAADSELLDGLDSTRFVYGDNATKTAVVTSVSTALPSGFYNGNNITGSPTSTWYTYLNMRHTNTANNYGSQLAVSFYSNADMYVRTINNGTYSSWSKVYNEANLTPLTIGTTSTTAMAGDTAIPSGNAVIDWTVDNDDIVIHSGNYTDTDTWVANSATAAGYVASGANQANKVWKTDANGNPGWDTDRDTVYTHPTDAGNKHIPTGGSAGQFLKYSASGTATWATPSYTTNTNTEYSAGGGLDLSGTTFSIESDLRDGVTRIGKDTSNYIAIGADTNVIDFHVGGVWVARMESDGDLHMKGDVIAFSDIFNP